MISVHESPMPAALAALVRQAVVALSAWAVGKGYFGADVAEQLIPLGIGLAAIAYGQIRGWQRHNDLVTAADAAPDSVATVKSG